MTKFNWPVTAVPPPLQGRDIHIWSAQLEQPQAQDSALWNVLTTDERSRADRFHFTRHRKRYIVARSVLRTLLGHYLNQAPASISIAYAAHGKPFLPENALYFNVSHSEDVGLFAFCRSTAIGVDIEHIRPLDDHLGIATRFFTVDESAVLQALPPEQQTGAFFECWTRKEAFIKAIGEGLSFPLDAFDVAFGPHTPARFIRIQDQAAEKWSLIALEPIFGYAGALAFAGPPAELILAQWDPSRPT